jgi:hypothetical protein
MLYGSPSFFLESCGRNLKVSKLTTSRQPAPAGCTRIAVGDVGFIRRGRFNLLFSAGSPLGERRLGEDVPTTFEELNVGPLVHELPRAPCCLLTANVRSTVIGSAGPSTEYVSPFPTHFLFQNASPRPPDASADFSFELTGDRGAALVTKHSTYREDSLLEDAFTAYTKRHYESWVSFARQKRYGNDIRPVLVSGYDMTRDYAMTAYSFKDIPIEPDSAVSAPILVPASSSSWGTWLTKYTPHTNHGPQEHAPLPPEKAIDTSFLQSAEPGTIPIPSSFNQCVFIRYYTMRPRGLFRPCPKVIRASAGPHDLGPGDNTGGTFPELMVQSDAELSDNEYYRGRWDPTIDGTDPQPDVGVHNTPYVWFLPCASVSALTFAFRIRNTTAGVPLQIMYSR